jgi:hypothetical protein
LKPSEHVGAAQVEVAGSQTPLWQSAAVAQPAETAHGAQLPPQSTPVSSPSRTPFAQVVATQRAAVQVPLWQSPDTTHARPTPQAPHPPPQSTSVSVPFFTASVQLGA